MPRKPSAIGKREVLSPNDVLARQLPRLRLDAGIRSQRELAERVKAIGGSLDQYAIAKIETGSRGVSLDEALLLAVALGLDPAYVFFPMDDSIRVAVTTLLASCYALIEATRDDERGEQLEALGAVVHELQRVMGSLGFVDAIRGDEAGPEALRSLVALVARIGEGLDGVPALTKPRTQPKRKPTRKGGKK